MCERVLGQTGTFFLLFFFLTAKHDEIQNLQHLFLLPPVSALLGSRELAVFCRLSQASWTVELEQSSV